MVQKKKRAFKAKLIVKKVNGKTKIVTEEGLNEKQELFCQVYATDKEMFGNGTQSYLEVYGLKDYTTGAGITYDAAMAASSRLLSDVKIISRINSLLETGGFNDQNVDKQHLFLINQYADKKVKLGAISEYNKLKARITNKLDITTKGKAFKQLEELSNDELARLADGSQAGISA